MTRVSRTEGYAEEAEALIAQYESISFALKRPGVSWTRLAFARRAAEDI